MSMAPKPRGGRRPAWAARLAEELVEDADLWDAWLDEFGLEAMQTADLLPLCGAFSDRAEQSRAMMLGRGLGALARRRVVLDLGGDAALVVQYIPNETDPRLAGGWRLWPVPRG